MKKCLLPILFVIIALIGCNKPVDVVIPTIIQLTNTQSAGDSVKLKLEQGVVVDGQAYTPDSITWQVVDVNDAVLQSKTDTSIYLTFVTDDIGLYTIKAKIYYNHNKSITAIKQVSVSLSTGFLQRKLIGHWTGTAQNYLGTTWAYTMTIDSVNGHYLALLTTSNIPCVTWYGEGYDNIPTPLKKLVINDINNSGKATGYWYTYFGDHSGGGYATPYDVRELHFSNNYSQLDFEFFPDTQHYSYTMTRQ